MRLFLLVSALPTSGLSLNLLTNEKDNPQMRSLWALGACLGLAAAGFVAGRMWPASLATPVAAPGASAEIVAAAQRSSYWGLNPVWINFIGDEALFRRVRARAFAFCFRGQAIDPGCANDQDEAVHAVVLALLVADAQQHMTNKDRLGRKERWVANHPEIVSHTRSYCWRLYAAHGGMDARLLAVCLGNLTDFSPLESLPVS
jgi:hypothetical protein